MKRLSQCIAFLVLLTLMPMPCKGSNNWVHVKTKQGVEVSTRTREGYAVKEFRGETIIQAPVEVAYEVLNDSEHFYEWFGDCRFQETTCKIDNYSKVIHHIVNVPVLKDRNVVARVEFQPDFDTGILKTTIRALSKDHVPENCTRNAWIPESSEFVRITTLTCSFDIQRLNDNTSRVVYTVLVDPGGHIPAWVANYFAVNNPVHTLSSFKKILKRPDYWQRAGIRHNRVFVVPGDIKKRRL